MTRDDFDRYLADLQQRWPLPVALSRSFRTAEQWKRWSSYQFRARAIGDREAELENVLGHRRAVVLGEAGSGKSVVARSAIGLGARRGFIPIFVPLKEYSGDLEATIGQHSTKVALHATEIDGTPSPRLFILDGLDEVPADCFNDFIKYGLIPWA